MKKIYLLSVLIFSLVICSAQPTYTWTGKPRYQILATQNNATLGIINVELFPKIAPYHVRNFDSLVSKQFYDTCAFHRVVPGFVIQGGDPNSRSGPVSTWGYGQPGQPTVKAEFSAARHERGILSAARQANNINSATSQFFICVATAANLNGNYSVYGRVTSGMSVVDAIVSTPTVFNTQRPVDKVEMFISYIGSNDTIPLPPQLVYPVNDSSNVDTNVVTLKWNRVNDAQFYHLDVSLDSNFSNPIKNLDISTLSYVLYPLIKDTTYYWRVKANNGGHISTSPTWHFNTLMRPPQLIAPANDSIHADTSNVVLQWNKSLKAVEHYVFVSHNSQFSDTVAFAMVNQTFSLSLLDPETTYFWRIKAKNGKHRVFSQTWKFTTFGMGGATGLSARLAAGEKLVYPNPSAGKFHFANTAAGEIIEVFSLDGRLVKRQAAIDKNTLLDLSEQAKGSYQYKISRDGKSQALGRLILN